MTMTFLLASLVIAVTPGPGVLYIVTRSITQGRAAGFTSLCAVALGNLGNAFATSLGLAALFALSTTAFTLVKFAGALYLIYLGIRTWRTPAAQWTCRESPRERIPTRGLFIDGVMVALFNPKTAIFFAAFVPQFLNSRQATIGATLGLSVTFVMLAATTDAVYVLMASLAREWMRARSMLGNGGRFIGGGALIALGLYTGLTGERAARS
jgi:threonine/homoserine/homoserine lactone efflux protein